MSVIIAAISNIAIITVTTRWYQTFSVGMAAKNEFGSQLKHFLLAPIKWRTVYKFLHQNGNIDSHLQINLGLF
jgi:hypothetical protein